MNKQEHDSDFTQLVFDVDAGAVAFDVPIADITQPFTHPINPADFDAIAVALTGAALVLKGIVDPTAQRTIEWHAIAHRRDAERMRQANPDPAPVGSIWESAYTNDRVRVEKRDGSKVEISLEPVSELPFFTANTDIEHLESDFTRVDKGAKPTQEDEDNV